MSRDPFDTNPNLPPWLREQPLPPRPHGDEAADQPTEQQHGFANADAHSDTSAGDIPDWLRGAGETSAAAAGAAASDNLPDWLREIPAESPAEEPLPDWLRETPAGASQPASESEPDWLREPDPASTPTGSTGPSETVPDWLLELAEDGGETAEMPAPEPATEAESVPDWLRAMADEPASTPNPDWSSEPTQPAAPVEDIWADSVPPPQPSATPDWLSSPDQPTTTPDTAHDDADIADWLRDIPMDQVKQAMEAEEETPTTTPFSLEGIDQTSGRAAPSSPSGGPPSWFGEDEQDTTSNWFDPPAAAPSDTPSSTLSDDDAPSWLRGMGAEADSPAQETNDWLGSAAPLEAPPTPSSTSETDSTIPSWLQDAGAGEQTETTSPPADSTWPQDVPAQSGADDNTPDWLRNDTASTSGQTGDASAWLETSSTGGEETVPAWLREHAADTPEPATTSSETRDENLPDWLGAAEPSAESPATAPPAGEEIPEWLRDTAATPPPQDDASLPVWLRSEASESAPAEVPTQPVEPKDEQDLPPWLRDESGAALPTANAPGEQDLPPWLKGSAIGGAGAAAAAAATPELPAEPAPPSPTAGWFDEALANEQPETVESDSEFLGGTDLPAWLRQPEAKPTPAIAAADSRALDWLTRLGTPEEEEAPQVVATTRLSPPPSPVRSAEQLRAISLLEQLAADPGAQSAQPFETAQPSLWQRVGAERLLYLLLLAALLVGIAAPSFLAPLEAPPSVPRAQRLFDQVNSLGPDDIVLIGYDWDARRVAELRPLEDAVIDQLIAQKVKLVLMSTDPQGSLLLYDLRDKLRLAGYQQNGDDYILLGYQPGGEFALRSLAQDFGQALRSDFLGQDVSTRGLATGQSTGTNKPLASLSDFSMIMLLADDQVDVQSWMEQVQRTVPSVPFATLLTAEAAPAAEPYLRQDNVYGLSGTTGALAYNGLRGNDTAAVAALSGQLRLGLATFAALLLVGGIITAIVDAMRRRRA